MGYANGPDAAPSYQEVCASSGHAETVRIDYDERTIPLTKLLDYYFMIVDPLSVNRQGHDEGVQYRTGIYYTEEDQLKEIRAVVERRFLRPASPNSEACRQKTAFPFSFPCYFSNSYFKNFFMHFFCM